MGRARLSQEGVVFALAVAMFVLFALTLNNFLTAGNLIALVRSVSILGILGLGMGLVVIGRGIDLAMVATMVVSLSWVLSMAQAGTPLGTALVYGAVLALAIGLISGILIAYADIPAIFTTLAMGLVTYGFGRAFLFQIDVQNTPAGIAWFDYIGRGSVLGLPMPIVEAVAYQRRPGQMRSGGFWVTGAVHVASALVAGNEPDEAYLRSVGMLDKLPQWRELVEPSTLDEEVA